MRPPRVAEWLLRLATPRADREFLLADIGEEFERVVRESGPSAASRWYWRQAAASIRPLGRERAERQLRRVKKMRGVSTAGILGDFSQAARFLRRRPAISLTVVATLTVAFSVTLAAYSIIHAVMLAPLPFASAEQIVTVRVTGPTLSRRVRTASRPDLEDWRERSSAFAALGAYTEQPYRLTGRGEPRQIDAVRVTSDFARVFGIEPALGRGLNAADFTAGSQPVVLVSHAFWVSEFGKSPAAVGQLLRLDDRSFEIVGVLPDVGMPLPTTRSQIWVPLIPREGVFWEHARGTGWLSVIGRIRDGVTIEQADADLSAVAQNLAREYPDTNRAKIDAELVPFRTELTGPVAPMLQLLAAALAAVMIVGCANIGSLLAASGASRQREFAIRSAIGAGRLQLAGQIAAETVMLCAAAALLSLVLFPVLVAAFLTLYPSPLPRTVPQGMSVTMVLPALTLGAVVAILLIVPQLLRIVRLRSTEDLNGVRTISTRGERASRGILVGLQVALSFVLIAAGTSFVRTVSRLYNVDPGYRSEGVLVFGVSPSPSQQSGEAAVQFYRQTLETIREMPGIVAAGSAVGVPMTSYGWQFGIRPPGTTTDVLVAVNLVSPGYLETLGIRLREGRLLTDAEQNGGAGVAMINEPLARVLGGNVVGRKFPYSGAMWEIVGVIEGVRQVRPRDDPRPELFIPWHMAGRRSQSVVVRTEGDPLAHLPAITAKVHAIDPSVPLTDVARLDDRLRDAVALDRFRAVVLATLSAIAVVLAALGAYSITAFSVARRSREYGIRLALGERPSSVGRRAIVTAMLPAAIGIVAGIGITLAGAQWVQTFLYGVTAADAATIIGTAAILLVIAVMSAAPSARRAASIDPVLALLRDA
jgi:putative ABC transport system permease protein